MKSTPILNTSSRKQITHSRIVEAAGRAIRRSGYDGTGVADIMKEAGLTHGGFYAHFASRDAMLAEVAEQAGAETITTAECILAEFPSAQALQVLMSTYLSDEHTANIEAGCFFAALGSEMPRQVPEVREASTLQIKKLIAIIERQLSDSAQPDAREKALLMISTMVGTLVMARAVDDFELCNAFRQASLKHFSKD